MLYRVAPGDSCIITSSCLLGHSDYNARGIAESPLRLLLLPADLFEELMFEHAPFRDFVFHLFAERIAELMQLVEEVAFRPLDQRLARLLLAATRACSTSPTSSWPTNWAACAKSSAACSRVSPSRAWFRSGASS